MKSRRAAIFIASALLSSACARPSHERAAQLARERLVSSPSSIAFVSSDRASSSGEIRFGGPLGRSALYLKFSNEWRAHGTPLKAFLALSAREGSVTSDVPVTVEAWRVSAHWQPQALRHWSDKPSLSPPYARARTLPSAAQDLRIDVTEIVRFAALYPDRDFGIAIIASGSEGPAAIFNTGFAGGQTPRLELYFR